MSASTSKTNSDLGMGWEEVPNISDLSIMTPRVISLSDGNEKSELGRLEKSSNSIGDVNVTDGIPGRRETTSVFRQGIVTEQSTRSFPHLGVTSNSSEPLKTDSFKARALPKKAERDTQSLIWPTPSNVTLALGDQVQKLEQDNADLLQNAARLENELGALQAQFTYRQEQILRANDEQTRVLTRTIGDYFLNVAETTLATEQVGKAIKQELASVREDFAKVLEAQKESVSKRNVPFMIEMYKVRAQLTDWKKVAFAKFESMETTQNKLFSAIADLSQGMNSTQDGGSVKALNAPKGNSDQDQGQSSSSIVDQPGPSWAIAGSSPVSLKRQPQFNPCRPTVGPLTLISSSTNDDDTDDSDYESDWNWNDNHRWTKSSRVVETQDEVPAPPSHAKKPKMGADRSG